MKSTVFNIIAITCISLLFCQCKKVEDTEPIQEGNKLGEVKLSSSELNLLPYELNDSVIFKDSLGDSQLFIVDNRQIVSPRYYKSGGTDITTDYYEIEHLRVLLKSENGNYFDFELVAPMPQYVSNFHINKNYFIVRTSILNSLPSSFNAYIDTMDFYYNLKGNSIPFYTNFTVLNNTYNDVFELTNYNGSKVYYNTSLGVVACQTEDKEFWYLDN